VGPYFSSFANMAMRLAKAGADGLVVFNRFYQPDFDLEQLDVVPNLALSSAWEMRLPLRWVSILYGRVPVDFAITSGVHTYEDVLKGVMAGASVTMMASELLRNGVKRINLVMHEVERWLEEHEYISHQPGAGQHEPAQRGRAGRLRARQLHEGSQVLEV
jgi:dihydroorotate dehydrogenase (fumarate)